ncbi:AAA family ATPase [Flavobacterium oreochromis]|uniref:AAA family ATPase n=1 Tax=Flavobacterium oreochromis TaxID=2906078 RepID=A0ABW8P8Y2_9FLAO|nr:AAA family ATPase [Flavobacterium oreochromis]OWP75893.1 hypothetical protein BWG23_09485 [Flavobacterium oreochromis]
MSFKLLAIRPLEGCNKKLLKNLEENRIYKFYNDYTFHYEQNSNELKEIAYTENVPADLYSKDNVKIKINVSAIVGKNGSGKSTIIELLSQFLFCISLKFEHIISEDFIKDHSLNEYQAKQFSTELENFNQDFNISLIYELDDSIYQINKIGADFEFNRFEKKQEKKQNKIVLFDSKVKVDFSKIKQRFFFYTILENYSLYGLNTNDLGIWLKSIFHKNDGYQTPIVLNPMRTEGVIDVNRLTFLSKQRLLSNIFQKVQDGIKIEDSLRNLVNDKIAHKITLKLDFRKFLVLDEKKLKRVNEKFVYEIDGKLIHLYYTEKYEDRFEQILKCYYPNFDLIEKIKPIDLITKEYILKKVFTIVRKYPEYKFYRAKVFRAKKNEKNEELCFQDIAKDLSHSTLKLRQAINFFVFNYFELGSDINKDFLLSTDKNDGISDIINLKIEKWKNEDLEKSRIKNLNADLDIETGIIEISSKYNIINFLPPSFFEVDIDFFEKGSFKDLSSGEKQLIYGSTSVIYHLLNLKSISLEKRVRYDNFNIIFDEIELCFHPEFQKKYVNFLTDKLKSIGVRYLNINIIFITHSPFILSDIPKQNVLFLSDGKPEEFKKKTFGANITDLLINSFFFSDTDENNKLLIGDFAKNKINETIKWLNLIKDERQKSIKKDYKYLEPNKEEKAKHKSIIDLIDEPLIKTKLTEMYYEVFDKDDFIDKEKEYILKRAKELGLSIIKE